MNTAISSEYYDKACALLTSQEKFHINLGLNRVQKILDCFNNPQDNIKCIHVAGTNGKGSTCAMLASVLQEAGFKTGLYTSPHLIEYTERIKINKENISHKDFAQLIFEVINQSHREEIPATEFEILTAAAFIYFYRMNTDIAVIETGLGGRLDATNTIKNPLFSVITDIDFDHTARLGSSIEEIAWEKAGIIKPNTPVITLHDNNGLDIIKNKAVETKSDLIFSYMNTVENIESGLKATWQHRNLSLVIEAVNLLRKTGVKIPEKSMTQGLQNTEWPARFQYIEQYNLLIDAAHNPLAAKELKNSLDKYFPDRQRIFIYSSLNTKNYKKVVENLFRPEDVIILTKNSSASCLEPEILAEYIEENIGCREIHLTQEVQAAFELYAKLCHTNDMAVLTGSIYTIGEFLSKSIGKFQEL